MGSLHDGHASLIARSVRENDVTCASIFVNPLQFNSRRDYESYPRDLESDYEILRALGCDMVFGGSCSRIFDVCESTSDVEMLDPGPYAIGLEGEHRPGHLEGVCTVVDRLFRIIGDCRAYFGEKDYQQLLVVHDLATRLGYPQVIGCATVRDSQGLALSSRNKLLAPEQIKPALNLFGALRDAQNAWSGGERSAFALKRVMHSRLDQPGIKVDYAEVRDPEQWFADPLAGDLQRAVALVATYIGEVRLIDNLKLDKC